MNWLPGLPGVVTNYAEMLQRLARMFAFHVFLTYWILQTDTSFAGLTQSVENLPRAPQFFEVVKTITGLSSGTSTNILLSTVLAVSLAVVSQAIHLHDILSTILRIRERFERKFILTPLAKGVGFQIDSEMDKSLRERRDELMQITFYSYASSTSDKPLVDRHYVHHALNNWSYAWISLEAAFLFLICACVSYSIGNISLLIFFVLLIVVYTCFFLFCYERAKERIKPQLRAILKDQDARSNLEKAFREI